MNEKLVTVVVPIYNVEKYLNCCIESIVSQTYRNLEILLIDDGSTDSCPEICDEWAKHDQRIQVIHKKNQGLGMARNTGIERANGEYICFFDSDDYIDVRTIETAYEKAGQYEADIVLYGLKDFDDEGRILSECIPETEQKFFEGDQVQSAFLPDLIDSSQKGSQNKSLPFSAWSCLFSMKLISETGWRFVSERIIISEDSYSLLNLYKNVNRVYVLDKALYYHRRNYGSLSRTYRKDRFEKTKAFAAQALKLADDLGFSTEVKRRIGGLFFNFTIDAMKHIVLSDETFKNKMKCIRDISKDPLMRDCLKNLRYGKAAMAKRLVAHSIRLQMSFVTYAMVYMKAANH